MAAAEGITFFQLNGIGLSLSPRAHSASDAGVHLQSAHSQGLTLANNTRNREEVDAVLAQAQQLGTASPALRRTLTGAVIMVTLRIWAALFGKFMGIPPSLSRKTAILRYRTNSLPLLLKVPKPTHSRCLPDFLRHNESLLSF